MHSGIDFLAQDLLSAFDGEGGDLFAQLALRQQAAQRDALARLTWLGEARGAQALCLDCPSQPTRFRPKNQANWLTKLATVLGIGPVL